MRRLYLFAGAAFGLAESGFVLYQASSKDRIGIVCLVGVVAVALGWYGSGHLRPSPALSAGIEQEFEVHVGGAVRSPRVIRAKPGMIVQDAVDAAGGATAEGDTDLLNLAAPLLPNSRVYVPFTGESDLSKLGPYGPDSVGGAVVTEQIDLNRATEAELDRLPGVGPVTAARIVARRTEIGGFRSVDQLLEVPGIGPKTLQNIRPYVKL